MGSQFRIARDDLTGAAITELLSFHLQEMHRWSPACKVHAMPVERLRQPDVTFYSAWARSEQGHDQLAACGALKEIDPQQGELKSMRAAHEFRGQGAGQAILVYLIEQAQDRNINGWGWKPVMPNRSYRRVNCMKNSASGNARPSATMCRTISACVWRCSYEA